MMLAFTIYNDGIQTIIKMASVYGTELQIDQGQLIAAILLVQFIGIPAAFAFGSIAGKLGAKRSIFVGLVVYTGICIFGYFLRTARDFWILAVVVGLVQGGRRSVVRCSRRSSRSTRAVSSSASSVCSRSSVASSARSPSQWPRRSRGAAVSRSSR
jgi:MFS-type transporter involved in bile tolerance (Atg22 family)